MFELDITTLAPLINDGTTLARGYAATLVQAGPPSSLPDPVPSFVGELLAGIGSFIDGSVDRLGDFARSVTPGGA